MAADEGQGDRPLGVLWLHHPRLSAQTGRKLFRATWIPCPVDSVHFLVSGRALGLGVRNGVKQTLDQLLVDHVAASFWRQSPIHVSATPLRDARYFAERLRTAQVVPASSSTDFVAFGSTVTFMVLPVCANSLKKPPSLQGGRPNNGRRMPSARWTRFCAPWDCAYSLRISDRNAAARLGSSCCRRPRRHRESVRSKGE